MRCLGAFVAACATVAIAATPACALGISVPAATIGGLKPGHTATSGSNLIVISGLALEGWTLRVDDPAGRATDGRMVRSGLCSLGTAALASRLHLSFGGGLLTTVIDRPEYDLDSLPNPVVAHGSTPDTITVRFSQTVGPGEALAAGCGYGLTIRYTVSAA